MLNSETVRKPTALICILVLCTILTSCGAKEQQNVKIEPKGKVYFSYFDTVSYIYDYSGDSAERFDDRSADVSHILEEYHRLFDIYHEYAGINNLCTINRLAGGEPVSVDQKLVDFLSAVNDDLEIEFIGFCTDICVVSNALILKAFTYDFAEITVDSKCCAGVTPEKHEAALEVMKSCHITVIGE